MNVTRFKAAVNRILVDNSPLPLLFLILTILVNIAWTLFHGTIRANLTILGVITFAMMSLTHAALTRGGEYAYSVLLTTCITSYIAEFVGVHFHSLFGRYDYTSHLGPMIFGIPVLIPFAWFMMMYPCLLVGQTISKNIFMSSAVTGALMMGWDLYLDPQMTRETYWFWQFVTDNINGIPISNYVSWFVVSSVIAYQINKRTPTTPITTRDFAPFAMLMWVWLGSFLVNIVPFAPFLGQPGVAVSGFVGMGLVMVPVIMTMRQV